MVGGLLMVTVPKTGMKGGAQRLAWARAQLWLPLCAKGWGSESAPQ